MRHHQGSGLDPMSSPQCPLCRARKARRPCPALGHAICAVCCGTKRLVEITCPPTCGYLRSAKSHPAVAVRRREERELLFIASALHTTSERQRTLFAFLQTAIVQHAATAMPRPIDRDVADAAAALAVTFETAAKGIIYEQQPASIPAQRLVQELRDRIEKSLRPSDRPIEADLAVALRKTEALATRAAAELEGGESAYLEFLHRRMAGSEAAQKEGPAIEPPLIISG